MAAAQAPAVYTAQAVEEYIHQRFIGNQASLEQRLVQAATYFDQGAIQLRTTDHKAEALAAKMVEDEQRIGEIVARANKTRDGVRLTHDKVMGIFKGLEALKTELESTIQMKNEEASTAIQSLRSDAAQEIDKLRKDLLAMFEELEAQAELKKTELQGLERRLPH